MRLLFILLIYFYFFFLYLAQYTFKSLCDVHEYLSTLLSIPLLQDCVLKHWVALKRMMESSHCQVIQQLNQRFVALLVNVFTISVDNKLEYFFSELD